MERHYNLNAPSIESYSSSGLIDTRVPMLNILLLDVKSQLGKAPSRDEFFLVDSFHRQVQSSNKAVVILPERWFSNIAGLLLPG